MRSIIENVGQRPKVILFLVTLFLLFVFNATRRPIESATHRAYDSWYVAVQLDAKLSVSDPQKTPEVVITLKEQFDEEGIDWRFATNAAHGDTASTDKLLRLLALIRVSGVLDASPSPGSEFHLTISDRKHRFECYFSRSDVTRNVSLGNFLKLLQIHAHDGVE